MPIITPKTQAEEDLIFKEKLAIKVGEAAHHLACVMQATSAAFYALPTDRLLAMLNANVGNSIAMFQGHGALKAAVNASLDSLGLPEFSTRAPAQARKDIVFNGSAFVFVPPPEPPAPAPLAPPLPSEPNEPVAPLISPEPQP